MKISMKTAFLSIALLCLPGLSQAESKTYMYDHIHMNVPEPQVAAQWYKDNIGGEWIDGRTDRLIFGTTRVMFLRSDSARPSEGGVIDHLGFSFTDLAGTVAQAKANGATAQGDTRDIPGLFKLAFLVDPFGTRLELIEDPQHLGLHHVHLRSPDPEAMFAWYEDNFGGIRTKMRGIADGILYPGNVWIMVSRGDNFPSQGAAIDHIGWRALDTEATLADLTAKNIEFTSEPVDMTLPNGMINYFYVQGPEGARVELVRRAPDMR
jgi:catechol 2,3-dioxygenase-like lactoylglutathione lyase family enzyme